MEDHDERLIWSIPRPKVLNREAWQAISEAVERLHRGREQDDIPGAVGAAKELCEGVARVILAQRGRNLGHDASYERLINEAHKAIDRQPGPGLANDPEVRTMAQSAKALACQLGPMRNQRGTGHGRALPPDVAIEHAQIGCERRSLVPVGATPPRAIHPRRRLRSGERPAAEQSVLQR